MKGDDFWLNPETALSNLCQTIILKSGLPVRQIARALHKGEDLIYKWCNPNAPQLPSLLQFLELIRVTRQHNALAEICEIFERLSLPMRGDKIIEDIRILRRKDELPSTASLGGKFPDFTGDQSTEEYLRSLRGA